jgi:hypothetical protein
LAAALQPVITFDDDPSADPVALADRAAVTVRARGISVIDRRQDWLIFSVGDVEVIADNRTDASTAPAEFALEIGRLYIGPPDVGPYRDVELVVALHDTSGEAPTTFLADSEGFWIACDVESTAASVVVDPVGPGWSDLGTIDAIATEIRRSRGLAASTWAATGLACYGELAESGELEPLMGGQVAGFASADDAADDWLAGQGATRLDATMLRAVVTLPYVRYLDAFGNAQAVLRLVETEAGGYVVEGEEVCYYP